MNPSRTATWRRTRPFFGLLCFSLVALAQGADAPAPLSTEDQQFFESKVQPILSTHCYKCHSREADRVKGGLLLDTRAGLIHGGNSGSALVPGDPDSSLIIQAIRYTDEDLQMPPKGERLSDAQIADLTEWVRRGAPDPRAAVAKGSAASYGGVGRQHWAFQPVKKIVPPNVRNETWIQSPVDAFILAKLESAHLTPNPAADKRTLIRRVTFDLTGLPPTEAEIQAFLTDNSPNAFTKVVDRLLASPRYGERWGRVWLDIARYSDTKGDPPRRDDGRYPHAWTYRDYVIQAFNTDKPFNQFIVEQLAADRVLQERARKGAELAPDKSSLAALGFLTLGNQFDGRRDDIIGDQIDVTTKAFLGLTVACARCHDHKFDPIPQKDYYSLYGVFRNTVTPQHASEMPALAEAADANAVAEYLAKIGDLKQRGAEIQGQYLALRKARDRDPQKRRELVRAETRIQRELGDLESNHAGAPPRANTLADVPRSRDYPVLIRGEAQNRGEIVPRRFLEVLSPDPKNRPEWRNGSGRLELAKAIADPANPMTARVFVNRVWQQHFGQGFVSTPDDLGNMSNPPTHPELLDYLAYRFAHEGWSVKQLHRWILLSATYQQSSTNNPKSAAVDPDNQLLWRYNLRRLDFEAVHDALLAIAGTLDPKMGGKPVPLGSRDFAERRAVYTLIDRRNPPELLTQFDFPNPDVASGRRYETIVPQQALFLMNSPMVVETARKLTQRPEFTQLPTDNDRVTSLYLAVYQRPPTPAEVDLAIRYVKSTPRGGGDEIMTRLSSASATSQEQRRAARQAQRAEQQGRANLPAGGVVTTFVPLDPWTKLAHALFQSNEAMFVN